jgi:hypothetical protein
MSHCPGCHGAFTEKGLDSIVRVKACPGCQECERLRVEAERLRLRLKELAEALVKWEQANHASRSKTAVITDLDSGQTFILRQTEEQENG